MRYGLQLYSVRDITAVDFEGALRQVAEMGYRMVETAGFFGHSAQEVAEMLEKYGLTACSTHTPAEEVFLRTEEVIAFHQAIGCRDIVLPSIHGATKEELDQTVADVNRVLPIIREAGMRLHFHNHWREMLPNRDGLVPVEELARRTDILLQIDIFWTFNAGRDPLQVLDQYRDRIRIVHLKDGIPRSIANEDRGIGKSLGQGMAPVEEARRIAMERDLVMVVESEGLDPTGLDEVRRCIDYLKLLDERDGV